MSTETEVLAAEKGHEAGTQEQRPMTTAGLEKDLQKLLAGSESEPKTDQGEKSGEELQPGEAGQQAEAQAEVTTDQTGEAAEQAEHEESDDAEARKDWPESAQRRVDKLHGQKAELREQLTSLQQEKDTLAEQVADLEQKLEEAGTKTPAATPGPGPLGFLADNKSVSEYVSTVKVAVRLIEDYLDESLPEESMEQFKKWAEANGAYSKTTDEFDNAKLKQLRRIAQDALTDHVPQRMEFLKREATESASAEERFPFLKDPKSADYKKWREVVQTLPEIKRLPHWKGVAAIFVQGLKVVQGNQNSATKNGGTTAKKPGAKLPGASTSVPQRTNNGEGDAVAALREKAFKTQNPKDFEALVRAQLGQP